METVTDNPYKWLIIFLMHEDFILDEKNIGKPGYVPLTQQRSALIDSINQHEYNKNTKIIVIESIIEKNKKDKTKGSAYTYVRHQTEKNRLEWYNVNTGGFVIQDGASVKSLLDIIIQKEAVYDKLMLVTWGHGSIFGIFYLETLFQFFKRDISGFIEEMGGGLTDDLPQPVLVKNFTGIEDMYNLSPSFLLGKDLDSILSKFDILTNKELAGALSSRKADVLLMHNCLMQNLCTQYDFKDVVTYLVAPESGISHPGYNYREILNYLDKGVNEKQAADEIMESIRSNDLFKTKPSPWLDELEDTWAICYVNLRKIDYIAELFEEVVTEILNHPEIEKILDFIRNNLRLAFNYAINCLESNSIRDLHIILRLAREEIGSQAAFSDLLAKLNAVITEIEALECKKLTGKNLYKNGGYPYEDNNPFGSYGGVGIILPRSKSEIDEIRLAFINEQSLFPDFFKKTGYAALMKRIAEIQ